MKLRHYVLTIRDDKDFCHNAYYDCYSVTGAVSHGEFLIDEFVEKDKALQGKLRVTTIEELKQ